MVDKIKPLKIESIVGGGDENNLFPTEADPSEDFASLKGVAFEGSDSFLIEKVGGIIREYIPNFSYKYDTTYNPTYIEMYNGFTQTTPNRICRVDLTYSGDDLTVEALKIYSTADGTTVLKTVTMTHTYSSGDPTKSEVAET